MVEDTSYTRFKASLLRFIKTDIPSCTKVATSLPALVVLRRRILSAAYKALRSDWNFLVGASLVMEVAQGQAVSFKTKEWTEEIDSADTPQKHVALAAA